jgi:hypothetical protein
MPIIKKATTNVGRDCGGVEVGKGAEQPLYTVGKNVNECR